MYPDHDADRALYDSLVTATTRRLARGDARGGRASGQQEMLNWFCLVGAVEEPGLATEWSDYVETHVFNSNKCFAVFR